MAEQTTLTPAPAKTRPAPRPESAPEQPRMWRVVLLDDDEHSYEYVIEMLSAVFGFPVEKGYQLAKAVDSQGRASLIVTHREHAELKQQQVHSFGADPRIAACKGSMSARLEPAEYDEGDSDDASDAS